MIRVLVVDDSAVVRDFLEHVLNSDPGIRVVGKAANGLEAVAAVPKLKPDVVTMDIFMPKMDGYEATREILATNPVPIVVVSASLNDDEVQRTFLAVQAGAVAVLEKPTIGAGSAAEDVAKLIQTVKIMSELKVVRRWNKAAPPGIAARAASVAPLASVANRLSSTRVVAIGASTGGPAVVHQLLSGVSAAFPVPILVVQHIAAGFAKGFVEWLDRSSPLRVTVAEAGEQTMAGHAYVAPEGFQMGIDNRFRIKLSSENLGNGLPKPSVAYLFRSVAEVCGPRALGILLTGMGRDGADDLKLMKTKGAITIAQDKESCVVFGMPGEAQKLDAAMYMLPPEEILELVRKIAA